jgi:hypothetical protein
MPLFKPLSPVYICSLAAGLKLLDYTLQLFTENGKENNKTMKLPI